MSLVKTRVVDWLGIEKESGYISLTILDELDWSDEEQHLLLLQEKLNAYLAFVESGEVFERLVEEAGRRVSATTPVKVTIIAKFEPTDRAQAFLEYALAMFNSAGLSLSHRVLKAP